MESQPGVGSVGILVDVVDALGVERRGAAFDAVNLVALFEEKFCKVGTILASYARDQCSLCHCTRVIERTEYNKDSERSAVACPVWVGLSAVCAQPRFTRYRQFVPSRVIGSLAQVMRALAKSCGKSDRQRDFESIDYGAECAAYRLAVDKVDLKGKCALIESFAEFSEHIDG